MTSVRRTALVSTMLAVAAAILGTGAAMPGTARAKNCYTSGWRVVHVSVQVDDGADSGGLAIETARWSQTGEFWEDAGSGYLYNVLASGDTADPETNTPIKFERVDP